MKRYAIIVAGGKGIRMGSELPKQFLPIGGRPVLMHTLKAFHDADASVEIILVLADDLFSSWEQLCRQQSFAVPHRLIAGGRHRFDSVKNGLEAISDTQGLVAIHDGVRPFVSSDIILRTYHLASEKGNAVPVVRTKDSIRYVEQGSNKNLEREYCFLVQTPQTFRLEELKTAYLETRDDQFTDDASVLESAGSMIHLTEGSYTNIKITTPEDLLLAESILLAQTKKAR